MIGWLRRKQFVCSSIGGVTHRRLRRLWEWQLVNRWAFPGIRTHSEFYYYLDNQASLDLLAQHRALDVHAHMLEELRNNREKNYAGAAFRGQHMQLGFLQHSLMVSRMHFLIELACRKSAGQAELVSWVQGAPLSRHKVEVKKVRASRSGNDYVWQETGEPERLPVEPDGLFTMRFSPRGAESQLAHFIYEVDRGTMVMTDLLKKLRAYYHFIKKQQRHKEAFGIHPIRAVLIETTQEARARKIMKLVHHPLVCGPVKRAGLFWFTVSPLFTDSVTETASGRSLPRYLKQSEVVFDRIWALPDFSLHALTDAENSGI
jgi:Replication-relaxation